MIRKNLILLSKQDENTGKDVVLKSNYIPGCLDIDESLSEILNIVRSSDSSDIEKNLTNIRKNYKIIFNKVENFVINSNYVANEDTIYLCDNIYLINVSSKYIHYDCDTFALNDCKCGFYVPPSSIVVFTLKIKEDTLNELEYYISARHKI